jgi:uncharacterized membrane protein
MQKLNNRGWGLGVMILFTVILVILLLFIYALGKRIGL